MSDISSYSVSFKEIYSGIILEDFDEGYAFLEGLTDKDRGRSISGFLSASDEKRVRSIMNSYKGTIFSHSYVRSRGENGLWRIGVEVDHPLAVFRGSRFDGSCGRNGHTLDLVSAAREAVLVVRTDRGKAELSSPAASARNLGADPGEIIASLRSSIRLCSRSGKSMRAGVLSDAYKSAELVPFCSDGHKYVMIKLSGSGGADSELIADRYIMGTCVLDITRQGREYFCDINAYMSKLIDSGMLTKKDILSSYPYCSALSQGLTRFGLIGSGAGWRFLVGAVPVYEKNRIEKMMVFAVCAGGEQLADDSLFEMLTLRETNVVRLALSGMTGKSIGQALGISEGTVKRELFTSCRKLGVRGKMEIVMKVYHIT